MHAGGWVDAFASVAVRGAWESLLLAGYLAFLLRRVPGISPQGGFRAWGAGFALAALLPWSPAAVHTGVQRLFTGRAFTGTAALISRHDAAAAIVQRGMHGAGAHTGTSHAPLLHLSAVHLSRGWAEAVCALWAVATVSALLRFAVGAWALRRLVRGATPAPAAVQTLYRKLIREDGDTSRRARDAALLVADGLSAPSACGLFGACILLPEGLVESLSDEELECVLLHEAAHLRRRDDWWTIATRLVRAAMPAAVGLPYLDRQMARAREMACDDAALRRGAAPSGNAVRYAACLARLADRPVTQPWRGLAPGLTSEMGDGSQLAARVGHLLHLHHLHGGDASAGPARWRLAGVGIAAAGMACALLAAPTVLSFSSPSRLPHIAPGRLPAPAVPQPTATLALEKMRPQLTPARLRVVRVAPRRPVSGLAAQADAVRPAALDLGGHYGEHTASLHVGTRPRDTADTPRPTLLKLPQNLLTPPPAVLLFWSGAEGGDGSNLVFVFTARAAPAVHGSFCWIFRS